MWRGGHLLSLLPGKVFSLSSFLYLTIKRKRGWGAEEEEEQEEKEEKEGKEEQEEEQDNMN